MNFQAVAVNINVNIFLFRPFFNLFGPGYFKIIPQPVTGIFNVHVQLNGGLHELFSLCGIQVTVLYQAVHYRIPPAFRIFRVTDRVIVGSSLLQSYQNSRL
ncbi:hypothetical protein D9M69_685820 [compost metagenome]